MKLQIDIKKVINLLAKDIYDSPYALLRENLQNAYDAVLMRKQLDPSYTDYRIEMTISPDKVVITDNGIGMTVDVVENNFWKAGASGKNTEEARKAGVVGTFGIGAMANFGVCEKMEVHTRYFNSTDTIITSTELEKISLTEDCIDTKIVSNPALPIGTTVIATLRKESSITIDKAISYLRPFVQYLPMPVMLNNQLISQQSYLDSVMITESGSILCDKNVIDGSLSYKLNMKISNRGNGQISVHISNIVKAGQPLSGEVVLRQDANSIYGLRNGFGLAGIPLSSNFRWGGVANLKLLVPTAGRDSLTRESVDMVSLIVSSAETQAVELLSNYDACDGNQAFLAYVYSHAEKTESLAGRIRILRKPLDDRIPLNSVQRQMANHNVMFYPGHDEKIISLFANENTFLLVLGNDVLRKNIQLRYLNQHQIPPVPDEITITKKFDFSSLELSESSIAFRTQYVLEHDYLMNNVKVVFAEISHEQPVFVKLEGNTVAVYLARKAKSIENLKAVYDSDYSIYDGFIKDYVRQHLYPKLSNYVPSSTREGAETLRKIMLQKQDLYTIEQDEIGYVDEVIKDYLSGKATLKDVHRASSSAINSQRQQVNESDIGSVESVMPSVQIEMPIEPEPQQEPPTALIAMPPINNMNLSTDLKLLKTNVSYPALNNYKMFLGLSDRLFERYSDFFFEPHTTKVIWSTHKIVYVFTHVSNQMSMYYDIDLQTVLPGEMTGGHPIISTTILTKNRIFVPVIPEMYQYFDLAQHQGKLEFYVRFDPLTA
jgi:molecular chaperone HtpG